jgi:hypothetical protein
MRLVMDYWSSGILFTMINLLFSVMPWKYPEKYMRSMAPDKAATVIQYLHRKPLPDGYEEKENDWTVLFYLSWCGSHSSNSSNPHISTEPSVARAFCDKCSTS